MKILFSFIKKYIVLVFAINSLLAKEIKLDDADKITTLENGNTSKAKLNYNSNPSRYLKEQNFSKLNNPKRNFFKNKDKIPGIFILIINILLLCILNQ